MNINDDYHVYIPANSSGFIYLNVSLKGTTFDGISFSFNLRLMPNTVGFIHISFNTRTICNLNVTGFQCLSLAVIFSCTKTIYHANALLK